MRLDSAEGFRFAFALVDGLSSRAMVDGRSGDAVVAWRPTGTHGRSRTGFRASAITAWPLAAETIPQHLYFALHVHAAWFAAFALMEAARNVLSHWVNNTRPVGVLATIYVVTYAVFGFRNAYDESVGKSLLKMAFVVSVYFTAAFICGDCRRYRPPLTRSRTPWQHRPSLSMPRDARPSARDPQSHHPARASCGAAARIRHRPEDSAALERRAAGRRRFALSGTAETVDKGFREGRMDGIGIRAQGTGIQTDTRWPKAARRRAVGFQAHDGCHRKHHRDGIGPRS